MSSLKGLIAERDEWEARALAAEAELAELRAAIGWVVHEVDRARMVCERFKGTRSVVDVFRKLAAVLRSLQEPSPADRGPAPVLPLKARSS